MPSLCNPFVSFNLVKYSKPDKLIQRGDGGLRMIPSLLLLLLGPGNPSGGSVVKNAFAQISWDLRRAGQTKSNQGGEEGMMLVVMRDMGEKHGQGEVTHCSMLETDLGS